MGDFVCEICNKSFKQKVNLKYHIDNKVCDRDNINGNKLSYECNYCKKKFTTATSMSRHVNHTCKVKKQEDEEKEEIFERLLKLEENNKLLNERSKKVENENKMLKKEVKKLAQQNKKITNNNVGRDININNGAVNNGTVNHVTLVAFGSEDMTKIDEKDLIKVLQQGYNSTLRLTETVHFNPKYPEFQNVYITNMKDKYAMMYDGTNWTLTLKDDLINRLYDDKKSYIEERLEDFIESLTLSQRKALDRWVDTDEDNKKIREIKEKIKLLLYNSKQIPIDTQKLIDDSNIKVIVESKSAKDRKKRVIKNVD